MNKKIIDLLRVSINFLLNFVKTICLIISYNKRNFCFKTGFSERFDLRKLCNIFKYL